MLLDDMIIPRVLEKRNNNCLLPLLFIPSPLFDAPQAASIFCGTPFVPTLSEGNGAQDGSKAPPLGGGT
jgi:hypothetical protein